MTRPASQRLHYYDMLKGIAIFMVVAGHILTMCIREIDRAAIFKFIGEIHMPLFFFISGVMSLKLTQGGDIMRPDLAKRALQLLVPMVVVSSIWIYYFPHSGLQSPLESTWSGLWHDQWKNGYWFTLCLFEIIAIYGALTGIMQRCRVLWQEIAVTVIVWAVLGILCYVVLPQDTVDILGLGLTMQFFPAFMAGVIARRHADGFNRLVASSGVVTASLLIGGALLYFISWPWEFGNPHPIVVSAARSLFHIALAITAIAVVKPWSVEAYSQEHPDGRPWARMWSYLGTHSLEIYLLHYFFLFPMGWMRVTLAEMNLAFVPLLAVASAGAAAVIAVTLGLNYIISKSKILSLLLTGR